MDQFSATDDRIQILRQQVAAAEVQLAALRTQLARAEQQARESCASPAAAELTQFTTTTTTTTTAADQRFPLQLDEYKRYGRQLIVPEFGLRGQQQLKRAKVLIVGLGGLGSPAAAYLAGAGVGTLGLVDGDTVELSNLHRQIAHATPRVGMLKVDSAVEYLSSLNPSITYNRHPTALRPAHARALFAAYDLVLDCTDRPATRYLISDACVATRTPLISAAALKSEGQLLVLNHPASPPGESSGGPCYRCVFPQAPPAETQQSCSEAGILGPVVGVMGVLQAVEALKLLASLTPPQPPTLLLFSAFSTPAFRSVRLRPRRKNCAGCSASAGSWETLTREVRDGGDACPALSLLPHAARVTARDFDARRRGDGRVTVIDVRDATRFALCALPGSVNVPWTGDEGTWLARAVEVGAWGRMRSGDGEQAEDEDAAAAERECVVVCRLGNDSQRAVQAMLQGGGEAGVRVRDVRGGFAAWRDEVDAEWPDY